MSNLAPTAKQYITFETYVDQSWGLRPQSYDKTGLKPASAMFATFGDDRPSDLGDLAAKKKDVNNSGKTMAGGQHSWRATIIRQVNHPLASPFTKSGCCN